MDAAQQSVHGREDDEEQRTGDAAGERIPGHALGNRTVSCHVCHDRCQEHLTVLVRPVLFRAHHVRHWTASTFSNTIVKYNKYHTTINIGWSIRIINVLLVKSLQIAIWHCVVSGIISLHPFKLRKWRTTITFLSCAAAFSIGLFMATEVSVI